MIGIYKLGKIISFITETTKDPYFLTLLNTVTSLLYREQQGLERHIINGVIQYNAHLKGNPIRDD